MGNDTLDAGAGTGGSFQYLFGEAGSDTYRISRNDGLVFVDAGSENATSGTDKVVFSDLTMSDLSFATYNYTTSSPANGVALRMLWTGGEFRVGQMGDHIESFEFADGMKVSSIGLTATHLNLTGTAGNDIIHGSAMNDRIYGGAGNDTLDAGAWAGGSFQYLFGEAGSDTYRISRNDGLVFVDAGSENATSGTDKVVFSDLTMSDLSFATYNYTTSSPANGVALRMLWTGGEFRVGQMGDHIESFEFADGMKVSSIGLTATHLNLTGTAGNDIIHGSAMNDRIYGGAGNDTLDAGAWAGGSFQYLFGEAGSDTYRISRNDGLVFVDAGSENDHIGYRQGGVQRPDHVGPELRHL